MLPPLDELFRHFAVAKGDVTASVAERGRAEEWCRCFIDKLTHELQRQHPGALSITHESVQATTEAAYREYRRAKILRATRRRLQGD